MSLMNLQTYLNRLSSMNHKLNLTMNGKAGMGWNTMRGGYSAVPDPRPLQRPGSVVQAAQTVELAIECSYASDALRPPITAGYAGVYQDRGVSHVLNPDLAHVQHLLMEMFTVVNRNTRNLSANDYMVHVNDMDHTSAMTRPTATNQSYLGTQMALISTMGRVHTFTMDRVTTGPLGAKKYAWNALIVPHDQDLGVMTKDSDMVTSMPATGYVKVAGGRVAYFRHENFEVHNCREELFEYLTRSSLDSAKPVGLPTQYNTHQLNTVPSFLEYGEE